MPTDVYARSVVDQLMRKRTSPEIWEGAMATILRFLVTFLPLRVLVSDCMTSSTKRANISHIELGPIT